MGHVRGVESSSKEGGMSGDWMWTCTGCGLKLYGDTKAEAQSKFFSHVSLAHPNATVLSIDTSEGAA